LEELGIDGKILLEWICEQEKDASGWGQGPVAGSCEHDKHPSSIKGG
jgi:hypothetical protein